MTPEREAELRGLGLKPVRCTACGFRWWTANENRTPVCMACRAAGEDA